MGRKRGQRSVDEAVAKPRPRDPLVDAKAAVHRKRFDEARALLQRATRSARTKARRRKVQQAWREHGDLLVGREDFAAGVPFYEGALECHREGDDTQLVAEVANQCCFALMRLGRHDAAFEHGTRALALHEEAGRLRGVGIALYYLAGVEFGRGRVREAIERAERAVAITDDTGDTNSRIAYLTGLAAYHYHAGDTTQAEAVAQRALPFADALGLRTYEAHLWILLANVALDDGRLDEAETRYIEAHARFERAKLANDAAIATGNLGNLALERGDLDTAVRRLDSAIAIHTRERDDRSKAIVLTDRAAVRTELGQYDAAHADLVVALEILQRLGHERRVSFVRGRFARIAEARGELHEARAHYAEMEIALDAAGDHVELARMLHAFAGVEAELGQIASATALLDRADALDPRIVADPSAGAPPAGTRTARALRELAIARIEAARGDGASRASARDRLVAVERGGVLDTSSEARRVAGRLRAVLDRAVPRREPAADASRS